MEIPSASEISVVVQGPIVDGGVTEKCLASIRKSLPGAEIILSTWAGSPVSGLNYDRLVESRDPGPIWILDPVTHQPRISNVQRQINSTMAGLKRVSRKYALKIRTDFLLQGADFLKYFDQYQQRSPNFKLFEKRVLGCTVYARNPRRCLPRYAGLFHPGDFVFFGLTQDMLKLWDIDPATYTITDLTDTERANVGKEQTVFTRLAPEQCIWTGCLARFPEVRLPNGNHADGTQLLAISEESMANNLVLLEPEMWPVRWMKERRSYDIVNWMTHYTFLEWRGMYRKFCDSSASAPWLISSHIKKILFRLQRSRVRRPLTFALKPFYHQLVKWRV